jgi:hypothetical protein
MPEVLIKYKSEKVLKALYDLAKVFDISIEKPKRSALPDKDQPLDKLPITFAKNPDVTALAGIWEGRDISLEQLRKDAWGDRI